MPVFGFAIILLVVAGFAAELDVLAWGEVCLLAPDSTNT
jgi:hypothetical protein